LCLALIILLANFSKAQAQEDKNLQLKLGDAVSVYSEKAYRKDGGVFEAVGNVVILSGKETLYGEKASLNMGTGHVLMEGNVRFISRNITIYGSKIEFNSSTGELSMSNARIITGEFNVVAEHLVKKGENLYVAKKAEFTTCKDCTESWSIYGEEIEIELNQYVKISHALTKIKGIHILYLPFIALPIKTQRESGLLFPTISTRPQEGVALQQPLYWAIDESKDMTFTPSFWGVRGIGADLQYRQVFAQENWLEYNHRLLEDKIYLPGKTDREPSERSYFRHFYEFEAHQQWSNSLTSHIVATGTKDLDFFRDFADYTDDYLLESSTGASGFVEKRFMDANIGMEAQYRRNLFVSDPTSFDKSYVQTLPSVYFNIMPQNLYHSDKLLLQNVSFGLESDYTVFRQRDEQESTYLRNAGRFSTTPYLHWHFFNYGPVSMSSKYSQNFQEYDFRDDDEKYFQKTAGFLKTELSFTMDKIFGLAYEEKLSVKELEKEELKKVFPEKKEKVSPDLVGAIPDFEESLTEDSVLVVKNSFRHSQEFKFIHHLITNSKEQGNERFLSQIQAPEGWFDYEDAILEDQAELGSNLTRTIIPRKNTIEFQWNNLLIRKSPKSANYFKDQRYLRDNFNYSKVGFFNLSQGFLIDDEDENTTFNDRLTRLFVHTGYTAAAWRLDFKEYYFHQSSDQITDLSFQRRFGMFNFLGAYSANTLPGSDLRTLKLGGQVRPMDTLGFSALRETDLDASENIRTIYQADIMPNNNCWIFNVNYRKSVVDERYSVNFVFNLGNKEFETFRSNFFSFDRLQ